MVAAHSRVSAAVRERLGARNTRRHGLDLLEVLCQGMGAVAKCPDGALAVEVNQIRSNSNFTTVSTTAVLPPSRHTANAKAWL